MTQLAMPKKPRGRPELTPPFETYLREIAKVPLLSASQEKSLAVKIARGDRQAKDRFICSNLRLVVKIAKGYVGLGLSMDDLIQYGNIGLIRAVEGFDPKRGTRFSTYASYWIKQSIRRELLSKVRMIRLPNYLCDLLAKWRRTARELAKELGRPPTESECATRLNLSAKQVELVKRGMHIASIAVPSGADCEDHSAIDQVLDHSCVDAEGAVSSAEDAEQLEGLLPELPYRERFILEERFGLFGKPPQPLKEIGRDLGITRERVRQIESVALQKLFSLMTTPHRRPWR